ncbi:MAG: efflux RND transporter periplasmic adaptor subunit [Rhodobacteraceae bacterium]|nr:efflux RND transporter periplasmic adaptor subunit [Paracoccaceae bacterium]
MSRSMSKWAQVLVTGILGIAAYGVVQNLDQVQAALGLATEAPAARDGGGRSAARGIPVIVTEVATDSDDIEVEVVGTGRANRSVTLRSEEAGKITRMALAANTRFAAGDLLVQLDTATQDLALQLADAQLREATRIATRIGQLQGTGAVTSARLDEAQTQRELARLEVERARQALNDRSVRAPFDGVAGLPSVETGAWIDSAVEIASFDDRSVLLVEIDLPERLLSRVVAGTEVAATTPAFADRSFSGTVSAIDSRIDPQSRTARVRIAIPNVDDLLRPGASFTTRLYLPGARYPAIPELAVQFARGGLHVWRVAADDTAEQVPVRMIRRRDGLILVDGDLHPGDRVVVEGGQRLAPGRAVTIAGDA